MVGNPARGRLVAALAFVFAAAGIAPAASATLTVGKAAPNADPIIPVNVGEQLGIFKKHGLDLKIVDFTGGSRMTQAMAAGALDIGDGAGTEMALVAKGAPMIAICETAGPIPFIGIGVPWDSPIKTIDQLKGKKIGYSSAGSLTDWLTKELARKQGWAAGDVTGVGIGNGASSIIAAFREHLIDADVAVTSLFLAMEENKTGRLLFPVSKYEGKLAAGTLYASKHIMETRSRRGARLRRRLDRNSQLYPQPQGGNREDRKRHHRIFRKRDGERLRPHRRHVHQGLRVRRRIAGDAEAILRRPQSSSEPAGHGDALYRAVSAEVILLL